MVTIRDVQFWRMGFSGDEKFAEVKVIADDLEMPVIATFKQEQGGGLTLVNATGYAADAELDWFENNLHNASPALAAQLIANPGGQAMRERFASEVLAFGNTEEMLQDKFYYGE